MVTTIEKYLTPTQAARALNLSPDHIRQMERNGDLPAIRTATGRLFDPEDVERLRLNRELQQASRNPVLD